MAKIGDIYLGGAEVSGDQRIYNTGIGFFLKTDSRMSKTLSFESGNWEVELKEGQQTIVARCIDVLSEDEILKSGFKYCQQAIDLMSIEYIENFNIKETGNFHTILYKKDGKFILKQVQTAFSTFKTKVSAKVIDTNTGNIIPQPVPSEPKWTPALRYYRLSQNTNDLYEAYRNAFLCFEFQLNKVHPILLRNGRPTEREKTWFKDALRDIINNINNNSGNNNIVPLINYLPPSSSDPVEDFIENQYKIRCELFHAKGDQCLSNIVVPAESFNPIKVSDAYNELIILLKQIVINYYNIRPQESGMTYSGFKLMMESNLSIGCLLYINDDNSSNTGHLVDNETLRLTEDQSENDKQLAQLRKKLVSPKKYIDNPSLEFNEPVLLVQPNINDTGTFKVSCDLDKNELVNIPLIHRMSLMHEINFFGKYTRVIIFNNRDGLHLNGIDKFETDIYIKLKNIGDPQK